MDRTEELVEELRNIVGEEYVLTKPEQVIPYVRDASYIRGEMPLAVVLPGSADEISRVLRLSSENDVPVYVRGGGTSLTGSSVPLGGIVLSTLRLDRIIEVNVRDRYVIAEAGVRLRDLSYELSRYGYMYLPDPASEIAATVGGSISTNAGGLRGARYGTTKDWVLGLEVVLPDGTVTWFGEKTLKRSAGYDLASLMVGSEGTLGVITKAILKIAPAERPEALLMAFYDTYDTISEAISGLNERGAVPIMAEFLDRSSMEALGPQGLRYPERAESLLIIMTADRTEEVAEALKGTGPIEIRTFRESREIEDVLRMRRGLYSSLLTQRKRPDETIIIGDVVVPPSRISKALREIQGASRESGLRVAVFGHIGDGNIHLNVFASPDEMGAAEDLLRRTAEIAIRNDGCVSAEHGIGLEKRELLLLECSIRNTCVNVELMKSIKRAFDPRNILNRGKLFVD
ncbi:MAG: FAD-binding oxidoreductase [Nitrososphaeria archaeon]